MVCVGLVGQLERCCYCVTIEYDVHCDNNIMVVRYDNAQQVSGRIASFSETESQRTRAGTFTC